MADQNGAGRPFTATRDVSDLPRQREIDQQAQRGGDL